MKKMLAVLICTFSSLSVFANNLPVDPAKFKPSEMYRNYITSNKIYAWTVYPDHEYTVLLYAHPALFSNPYLKSDPITMTCNGYTFLLSPGNAFACTIKTLSNQGMLSYTISSDYSRNGADLSSVVVQ